MSIKCLRAISNYDFKFFIKIKEIRFVIVENIILVGKLTLSTVQKYTNNCSESVS